MKGVMIMNALQKKSTGFGSDPPNSGTGDGSDPPQLKISTPPSPFVHEGNFSEYCGFLPCPIGF